MSDFDLHSQKGSSQSQGSTSPQDLKDQVADAGAEERQRAGDALRASTDVARDKFEMYLESHPSAALRIYRLFSEGLADRVRALSVP